MVLEMGGQYPTKRGCPDPGMVGRVEHGTRVLGNSIHSVKVQAMCEKGVTVKCLACGAEIPGVKTPPVHIIKHVTAQLHTVAGVEFWGPYRHEVRL